MDVSKTLDHTSIEEQDVVSRYVGRKLSQEEAEAFEEHYFGCDRCWEEVRAATEVRAALQSETARPSVIPLAPRRRIPAVWGFLAVAAAVALAVGGVLLLRSREHSEIESLAAAASNLSHRNIEARLSGPFRHLPLEPVVRGTEDRQLPLDLRRAALEAQVQAREHKTARALRTAGLSHLLLSEWDSAIKLLDEARNAAPEDALVLSDLAAAYYSKARHLAAIYGQGRSVADLDLALRFVDEALAREPRMPEALFNRALVLEASGSREKAIDAWKAYLEVDGTSPWGEEARKRLQSLTAATESRLWERSRPLLEQAAIAGDLEAVGGIVSRFHQAARVLAEEVLLPAWAHARLADQSALSLRQLTIARAVAEASARKSHDLLLQDSIRFIESILTKGDPQAVDALVRGHSCYGRGQALYRSRLFAEAASLFAEADSRLSAISSPFRALPRLALARCEFNRQNFEACLSEIDRAESAAERKANRDPSLLGSIDWLRALVRLAEGFPHESLDFYRSAHSAFQRLHEVENVAAVEARIAENLTYLGNYERAWTYRFSSLTLLNQLGSSPRLPQTMGDAARAALREGHMSLALIYHDAVVDFTVRQGNVSAVADAFLWRSFARLEAGSRAEAAKDLAQARDHCNHIEDEGLRQRVDANIRVVEASLAKDSNPEAAIRSLDSALDFFRRTGNHFRTAQLNLERGGLYRATNQPRLAEVDFVSGIRELEVQRQRVREEALRVSYFETAQGLFDQLVQLFVERGDASAAWHLADEARARVLLDVVGRGAHPTGIRWPSENPINPRPALEDLRGVLPAETTLVEYYVLKDRLLAWTVRREGIDLTQTEIPVARLRDLAGRVAAGDGARPNTGQDQSAAALYDILIRPLLVGLRAQTAVVFVPDKFLSAVPYGALRNRETGRYLVEDYSIGIAPSASFLLGPGPPDHPHGFRGVTALVVGNPRLDGTGSSELQSLPAAAGEAVRIASYYPDSVILTDSAATKAGFLRQASLHGIIHFAGHAVLNPDNPSLSALLLAPDSSAGGGTGALYAHEVARIHLPRTRLVILAACEGAGGTIYALEGVSSLARSFLLAGVPMVVASTRPVADEPTALLFDVFHRRLLKGDTPIEALRAAQLTLLRNPDPGMHAPAQWAPFQVIGAVMNAERRRT